MKEVLKIKFFFLILVLGSFSVSMDFQNYMHLI